MNHAEKLKKIKQIGKEADFRLFMIDLLKKMKFDKVQHTHRYGSPELGKDIIAQMTNAIDESEWYSFVVKHGKITGGTIEIETIKGQINQSFEYPYLDINDGKIKVNKVKIVTNDLITEGAKNSISSSPSLMQVPNIAFWDCEEIIRLTDKYYPDFWLPGDEFYKEYSKKLTKSIEQEFQLKDFTIHKLEDKKVAKLLDIFISPYISESVVETVIKDGKDPKKELKKKKVSLPEILSSTKNVIITGEPGSGKTKVINNLMCTLVQDQSNSDKKTLPVSIKGKDLRACNYDIEYTILSVVKALSEDSFEKFKIEECSLVLFVDEIDVLNKEEKETLVKNLDEYTQDIDCKYILTQRKNENLDLETSDDSTRVMRLNNFDQKQVVSFIQKYFEGTDRGERFIEILEESNLLSKLPTTPLTVTLISLLHDEHGHEIPATLTDIYNDFTEILIGKLAIRSRADLLVFSIKRRLFSVVALQMLDARISEIPIADFEVIINSFLTEKGFHQQNRDDILGIINNSGVLYLDHLNNVGFKQQAFIEYFASVEIYDHARGSHYSKLLDNFNDVAWQNTAIFFAGRSKDYADMINDVINKMPNTELRDWLINTGGMGYLSQALYMTNKEDRKKLIFKSLDNIELLFNKIKELTKSDNPQFKDLPLPMIALMLTIWFAENFKSITLKIPLIDAFKDLKENFVAPDINDFIPDYKLFLLAATLGHKNIGYQEAFLELIERDSFIKNPVLMVASDVFLNSGFIATKGLDPEIKKSVDKQIRHHIKALKHIIIEPAYRFNSDYKLLDRGKSAESAD